MRARSGIDEPSIVVNSHTVYESTPVSARDRSAPPSADQPRILTTPTQERSARGVSRRALGKHQQVPCYKPGNSTRSASRNTHLTAARGTPVSTDDVDLGTSVKGCRVPKVHQLSNVLEGQCALRQDRVADGKVNACN